jgi:hypothetical protein
LILDFEKNPFDLLDFDLKAASKKEVLTRLSQILMVFFNVTLVLVGEPYQIPQQNK